MSTSQIGFHVGGTGRWSGRLERDDGSPVPVADITAATIVLRDSVSGSIVNSRGTLELSGNITPQDIRGAGTGAHGFKFEETTDPETNEAITQIGWDLDRADIALLSTFLAREEHYAAIFVEYNQGSVAKVIPHVVSINCLNPRRLLCSYEDVADGYLTDPDEKTVRRKIEDFICLAQERMEAYAERYFLRSTEDDPAIQYHSIYPGQQSILLDRWPVQSVVEVGFDSAGKFTPNDYQVFNQGDGYLLNGNDGVIEVVGSFSAGTQVLRTKIAGGLFDDIGQAPRDLRESCAMQAGFFWARRRDLGLTGIGIAGSSVTFTATKDLLDPVKNTLDTKYRRVDI